MVINLDATIRTMKMPQATTDRPPVHRKTLYCVSTLMACICRRFFLHYPYLYRTILDTPSIDADRLLFCFPFLFPYFFLEHTLMFSAHVEL